MHRVISAFLFAFLKIFLNFLQANFYFSSTVEARETSLNLTLSETPRKGFLGCGPYEITIIVHCSLRYNSVAVTFILIFSINSMHH